MAESKRELAEKDGRHYAHSRGDRTVTASRHRQGFEGERGSPEIEIRPDFCSSRAPPFLGTGFFDAASFN
jgi:hypothetical protein